MTSHTTPPNAPGEDIRSTSVPVLCVVEALIGKGKKPIPLAVAPPKPRKKRSSRRQKIDPTTGGRDYKSDEIQFMKAMDQYKRDNGRQFPTWSETLEVLCALGYRKVADPTLMPGLSTTMPPMVDA